MTQNKSVQGKRLRTIHDMLRDEDFEAVKSEERLCPGIINKVDEYGYPALYSYAGDAKTFDFLLSLGANVNVQTKRTLLSGNSFVAGETALHLAVWAGDKETVERLLKAEANPKIKDENGLTASALAQKLAQKRNDEKSWAIAKMVNSAGKVSMFMGKLLVFHSQKTR